MMDNWPAWRPFNRKVHWWCFKKLEGEAMLVWKCIFNCLVTLQHIMCRQMIHWSYMYLTAHGYSRIYTVICFVIIMSLLLSLPLTLPRLLISWGMLWCCMLSYYNNDVYTVIDSVIIMAPFCLSPCLFKVTLFLGFCGEEFFYTYIYSLDFIHKPMVGNIHLTVKSMDQCNNM